MDYDISDNLRLVRYRGHFLNRQERQYVERHMASIVYDEKDLADLAENILIEKDRKEALKKYLLEKGISYKRAKLVLGHECTIEDVDNRLAQEADLECIESIIDKLKLRGVIYKPTVYSAYIRHVPECYIVKGSSLLLPRTGTFVSRHEPCDVYGWGDMMWRYIVDCPENINCLKKIIMDKYTGISAESFDIIPAEHLCSVLISLLQSDILREHILAYEMRYIDLSDLATYYGINRKIVKYVRQYLNNLITDDEAEILEKSSEDACKFYLQIRYKCQKSASNHIYALGRKPSKDDFENGLNKFFKLGEKQLAYDEEQRKLQLNIWDGQCWQNASL